MAENVNGIFVSEKINKVRFKPESLSDMGYFVTGSWDNEVNHLVLWACPMDEYDHEMYPSRVTSLDHVGDVTEIAFLNAHSMLASSSRGSLQLLHIDFEDIKIANMKEVIIWDRLHYLEYGGEISCTGFACFEEDVATIGEDGRINLLTARNKLPLRVIDEADSCCLRCTCFLKHNELLTGNVRGHMKVWDLKSASLRPAATFMLSTEQVGVCSVTHHPTQRHLLLAGGEDGSVTVWDLRHNRFPVTMMNAHSGTVNELRFHPERLEHLFSCSSGGEVWHWDSTSMTKGIRFSSSSGPEVSEENPWLASDAVKHRLGVFSLMAPTHLPINSVDVASALAVCACDNEAVYLVEKALL